MITTSNQPGFEEELKAYVGSSADDYLDAWQPAIADFGNVGKFNVSGFILSVFWLSFRKMYRYALIIFGIVIIETVISELFPGKLITFLDGITGPAIALIVGFFGNRWYFNSARRTIAQVHAQGLSPEDSLKLIAKKGGVSFWGMLGVFLLAAASYFVLFIGVGFAQSLAESAGLLEPSSAEGYYNRGVDHQNNDEIDLAISDYDQAIQLNPELEEAYYNRGLAYLQKEDLNRAISDFDQAIQLNPEFAEAYINRGLAYLIKGDFDQVIKDANQAIHLNPNYANPYLVRGYALEEKGETEKATADFQKVLELCGDDSELCQAAQEELDKLGVK